MWVLMNTKSLVSSMVLSSVAEMSVNPFSESAAWQPAGIRVSPTINTNIHLGIATSKSKGPVGGHGPDSDSRKGLRLSDSSAADAAFAQHPEGRNDMWEGASSHCHSEPREGRGIPEARRTGVPSGRGESRMSPL